MSNEHTKRLEMTKWLTDRQNGYTGRPTWLEYIEKRTKWQTGLGIRLTSHPCRQIEVLFGKMDRLRATVVNFNFYQNWLSGFREVKRKECHIPRKVLMVWLSPFPNSPWARKWINHWSLWRTAIATPDLRLPSQP